MRKLKTFLFLIFIIGIATISSKVQSQELVNQSVPEVMSADDVNPIGQKIGEFFLIPFYEFSSFKKLELVSHTNNYTLWQGTSSYDFTDEEIQNYNSNFETEYNYSMTGIKVGYEGMNGLGVSGYFGVNHISFKSLISDENSQNMNSTYPGLSMGLAVDYQRALTEKLIAMALCSYNYSTTGSLAVENTSGEEITSSNLKSMYYEVNLVLAYHYKNFLPFAGFGFTQQFVNSIHEEKILTSNNLGEAVYNLTEFDSHFRGSSFYGFAGIEYRLNQNLAVYVRSSFVTPIRANLGLKIVI